MSDNNVMQSLLTVYRKVQERRAQQIQEIERTLAPLRQEHPEVLKVLEIVSTWKQKSGGGENESSHLH